VSFCINPENWYLQTTQVSCQEFTLHAHWFYALYFKRAGCCVCMLACLGDGLPDGYVLPAG